MFTKKIPILLFVSFTLFLQGCLSLYRSTEYFTDEEDLVTTTRVVPDCKGVILEAIGEVYLQQGDTQSVRIEADERVLKRIKTEKIGNNLVLKIKGNGSISKIKYFITLKEISRLEINGTGSIEVVKPIKSKELVCAINGNGEIILAGLCKDFDCEINGTGNISAFDFRSVYCNATVNGAGSCEIFATSRLNAEISGIGKIVYIGDPDVESEVNGVGAVYSR